MTSDIWTDAVQKDPTGELFPAFDPQCDDQYIIVEIATLIVSTIGMKCLANAMIGPHPDFMDNSKGGRVFIATRNNESRWRMEGLVTCVDGSLTTKIRYGKSYIERIKYGVWDRQVIYDLLDPKSIENTVELLINSATSGTESWDK